MDWLVSLLPLAILVGGVFTAYRVHDLLETRQYKHRFRVSVGVGVASLFLAQIVAYGPLSILPDVHLLATVLVMWVVGTRVGERYGTKWAFAGAAAVFFAFLVIRMSLGIEFDDRCYTDWDGRSNPTVCD